MTANLQENEFELLQDASRAERQSWYGAAVTSPEFVDDKVGVEENIDATPPLIPDEHQNLISAEIEFLSALVQDINELYVGPEQDEYGVLRPTPVAYQTAIEALIDAAIEAMKPERGGRRVPYGNVSTDETGGVRVEWIRPTCSVHFVVPATPDKPAYFYYEAGDEYGTEEFTPGRLAEWLCQIDNAS